MFEVGSEQQLKKKKYTYQELNEIYDAVQSVEKETILSLRLNMHISEEAVTRLTSLCLSKVVLIWLAIAINPSRTELQL